MRKSYYLGLGMTAATQSVPSECDAAGGDWSFPRRERDGRAVCLEILRGCLKRTRVTVTALWLQSLWPRF